MNKYFKGLLVLALVSGSLKCATNKTFDQPRPHGVNLAMEYTTWNELLQTKDEDRFGANFQVVPFYQDSDEDDELGKYFGVNNKHIFILGYTGANRTGDVNLRNILHYYNPGDATTGQVTIKYNPDQEAYGVRIDYYQDLSKILKGLYLKAVLPIVHVENDMELHVYGETGTFNEAALAAETIYNYFKGTYSVAAADYNGQVALTKAKINGHQDTTGVADIDIVLGYKFLDKEKYHMSINLGFTIPTGDSADGVWVWEPIVGNGDHWAFGGGLDFRVNLWTKNDQNIKFEGALNYRYLFEEHQNRTIRLKDTTTYPYSQYYLLAQDDDPQATPAANLLTKGLDVEPGSQIDAILALAYNNGGFRFELGYNFFWKDSEDVHLKDAWADDTYYLVNLTWNTTDHPFGHAADGGIAINNAILDVEAAATPSQDTHKLYGGLGYIFKEWEYPLMLNISAHYEWADEHDGGIENWGVWGKIGIAF